MGLTESKGNMYSWVTHTWNTIKGECPHGCAYCYMHRWGKQKPVRFDEKELKTDLGSGNFIFVGSSCDMFAEDIDLNWIISTLLYCRNFDNDYLFQSKNPGRMYDCLRWMPEKSKICTTIETNRIYNEIMGDTPSPINRAIELNAFFNNPTFVTIEPIMSFDLDNMVKLIKLCHPNQVNIGADSGSNNLPEPSKEDIFQLIDELKKFTVIDQKHNLNRLL